MTGGTDAVDESRQIDETLARQLPPRIAVEQLAGRRQQVRRQLVAGAQAHATLPGVIEEELAECTLETRGECLPAVRAIADLRQREFDVLAGSEVVGREVRTRAAVVAGLVAADDDAVAPPAVGVVHRELGKHRVVTEILEAEALLASVLPAQFALPIVDRQIGRLALPRQARRRRAALAGLAPLAVRPVVRLVHVFSWHCCSAGRVGRCRRNCLPGGERRQERHPATAPKEIAGSRGQSRHYAQAMPKTQAPATPAPAPWQRGKRPSILHGCLRVVRVGRPIRNVGVRLAAPGLPAGA
ncbi:MAG: hypothetical protein AW08_03563 [Candidatus Accumulibacter adjunctus]|uniref:Uncharacterized protein n=1 Tax=Candidatus Accumulibacter adjunctus TaxID=1454001 RepID=A0A011NKL7_9PROT|nr:MAG: hypothetical protein AW08_03563 [Candidatus Accumulibacter adjunctus]